MLLELKDLDRSLCDAGIVPKVTEQAHPALPSATGARSQAESRWPNRRVETSRQRPGASDPKVRVQ